MDDALLALRVIVSLAAVVALVWVVQRRLRRGATASTVAPIRLIGRQGLAGKASLVLVEVEGERLVLGVSEQGVSVLARHEAPADATRPEAERGSADASVVALPSVAASPQPGATEVSWAAVWKRAIGASGLR